MDAFLDRRWRHQQHTVELLGASDEGQEVAKSTPTDELEPVVRESIDNLTGGDQEFKLEILNAFLEDAPGLLTQMKQGVKNTKPGDLQIAAHSLKSNSADLGAELLRDLCKQAEFLGKEGNLEGAGELVERITAEYEKLDAVIQTIRAEINN